MKTLVSPHISEKGSILAEKYRQFAFKVVSQATKKEIKQAVELLFKVKVTGVQICNVKGKNKVFKQVRGKRKNWKKAYVTLQEGHDIHFAGTER